nr:ABC transporter permease subunit [Ardenticatena sp.]
MKMPRARFSAKFGERLLLVLVRLARVGALLFAITFVTVAGLAMARGVPPLDAVRDAFPNTWAFAMQFVRGDFGETRAGSLTLAPVPIADVARDAFIKSAGLLAVALLVAGIVGTVLGWLAVWRRGRGWSLGLMVFTLVGISSPSFFIAMLLQLLMIRWAQWQGTPLFPVAGFGWDKHIVLPALVLAARPIAQLSRITALTLLDVLRQDYVQVARSKGLSERQVFWRHVWRNAAIPILTTWGVSLRYALASLPVVEFFFGWPGVGFTLLKSIARYDDRLTVVLLLALSLLILSINGLLDLFYRWIDPRIREQARAQRQSNRMFRWGDALRDLFADLRDLVLDNALFDRLRHRDTQPHRMTTVLAARNQQPATDTYAVARRRAWLRGTLRNAPLLVGGILVLGLGFVALFGASLTPHSPYTTRGLMFENGEMRVPPFPPDEEFPWGTDALGRDMMSLVIAGARQTLSLALIVVLVRMGVGLLLGLVAGWRAGSRTDAFIVGVAEILAAIPSLLLAMLVILAVGIRQGMVAFVIGLSIVGWGEIMQQVRAQVIRLKPRPFIESAVAVGLRVPRLILNHIVPNIVPMLISIAALEMGAVLMLLGELGFIGIFIGGGAFAELDIAAPLYHYSDVPEWGALLANVRLYARAYPWMAIYPALAMFIAILAFNLLGEGIRRLVEEVGVSFSRLLNRYTLALALVVVLAVNWVQANTGATAFYKRQAATFDAAHALAHVERLADPAWQGRALGSDGLDAAAEYIAQQFAAVGVQPAGEALTFFQPRKRAYEHLLEIPTLTIEDGGATPRYHRDYAEYPDRFRNLGEARGRVRLLLMGELTTQGTFFRPRIPALENLDFSEDILLVFNRRDLEYARFIPRAGVLVVAENEADLQRRATLSPRDPVAELFGTGRRIGQDAPVLWISEGLANRLLAETGFTVDDFRRAESTLGVDEIVARDLSPTVHMRIVGEIRENVPVAHVVGYIPGTSDTLDSQMILVMAKYDGPALGPDGIVVPGANDSASAVAVMLEAARVLQESGYQPYKTILFVAYSDEGLEGGQTPPIAPSQFLKSKYGFDSTFQPEAIVRIGPVGDGTGSMLEVSAGGSERLARLVEHAADLMNVPLVRAREDVDLSIVFEERDFRIGGQEAPSVALTWQGWDATARTPADTIERIEAKRLRHAGQTLALTLMILGRETTY